jgi:hypothetical protein
VWNPEIPLAPVTIAVRPLMSGEKVGRFLKMPESFRGRCLEPMMLVGVTRLKVEERGCTEWYYMTRGDADGLKAQQGNSCKEHNQKGDRNQ